MNWLDCETIQLQDNPYCEELILDSNGCPIVNAFDSNGRPIYKTRLLTH